jgi:hypothetical protein
MDVREEIAEPGAPDPIAFFALSAKVGYHG